jgi:AP-3 complex subunit delta-1
VKYVALLAFNKIVLTHPFLVAQQEDVILECIDSEDITIRIKALDLVQGMVSSDNLVSIVSRLMRQLKTSSAASSNPRSSSRNDAEANSDEESAPRRSRSSRSPQAPPPLPEDYIVDVIGRILSMCAQNNYSHLVDFEWYMDVLTQLVRLAPVLRGTDYQSETISSTKSTADISEKIGNEIRNVAVKVMAIRYAAVAAAESILSQMSSESPSTHFISLGVIKPAAFVVGEFCSSLPNPDDALSYLLHLIPRTKYPEALATLLQAAIKILAYIAGDEQAVWTSERKSRISLLMARVIHALESLTMHPYLEVQERAVEFSELLKLTAEAVSGQSAATDEQHQDPPLLLTQAIPSLFSGWELHSVAQGAQKNVPLPEGLDLDEPIHPNLNALLAAADSLEIPAGEADDEFETYYNQKLPPTAIANEPAINRLAAEPEEVVSSSYQQAGEESYLDPDILARRKAERRERNKDDPFYIGDLNSKSGGTSTPIHNILQRENGPDLDIDSIPIMQLDLEKLHVGLDEPSRKQTRPRPRQKVMIAADETIGSGAPTPRSYDSSENNSDSFTKARSKKLKASLLQVDSSVIGDLSLEAAAGKDTAPFDYERQKQEEKEMAMAVKEVERLRLEMQRANERIKVAQGVPDEGTVLKKKKKKVVKNGAEGDGAEKKVIKKKKKAAVIDEGGNGGISEAPGPSVAEDKADTVVKPKKKKKRVVQLDGGPAETQE